MMLPPKASLLGIPRELRLVIYDHVTSSDLQRNIPFEISSRASGRRGRIQRVDTSPSSLEIPWINLRLTCRDIRSELDDYMRTSGNGTSYTLEIRQGLGHTIGTTLWHRIPCPPFNVSTLEATIHIGRRFRIWGDGGPLGILLEMYQLLNYILHCGPLFTRARNLPPGTQQRRHMKINRLALVLIPDETLREYILKRGSISRIGHFRQLTTMIKVLARMGLLSNYIDELELRTVTGLVGQGSESEIIKCQSSTEGGNPVVPRIWLDYGYHWGVQDADIEVKWCEPV